MLKRLLIGSLLLLFTIVAPAAVADEPLPKGAEGAFVLSATHGYKVFGLIGSTGEAGGRSGALSLFVGKPGAEAVYVVRGEVTREHVHFDLGPVGEVDLVVQPTGRMETVGSQCGKSTKLPGEEYVGTIAFHGEGGFAEVEASRAPLRLKPIFDLVCAGSVGTGTVTGQGLRGVELKVARSGGPRLRLDQNHPGAPVFYEAHMTEKEGAVRVIRTVTGRLGGGALRYSPSLSAAGLSAGAPFSGAATYAGKRLPRGARPGNGTWRGNLKIDFPGHTAAPSPVPNSPRR